MLLDKFYDGLELYREDRIIYAKFLKPHQVISTCQVAGGLRSDLKYLYNHQGCEAAGHYHGNNFFKTTYDPDGYREDICGPHGLPPLACATLGTAANMHHASIEKMIFKDLVVVAVVTGGVKSNAGRVGDTAWGWEGPDGYESLKPTKDGGRESTPGTINIMLFINRPLTAGALTGTIITATEAKSAALQELAVNSRSSDGLATGTGTDQIGVAALDIDNYRPMTSASPHFKLGELIGKTVKAALKGALLRQDSMTPDLQCSVKIHLERFGLTTQTLLDQISSHLPPREAELLRMNHLAIFFDPVVVAAVAALVHLKDKFSWGILPPLIWVEVMGSFAAQISAGISGQYFKIEDYRQALAPKICDNSNACFIDLAARAMAVGFKDKWPCS